MKLTASEIIDQLTKEVPASDIAPPPEDPVKFAEALEKEAAVVSNPVTEEKPLTIEEIEKMAKMAIVDEITSGEVEYQQRFCEIFSNHAALLPEPTEEEKVAATWVDDVPGSVVQDYLRDPDAELVKSAFLGNTGLLGRHLCRVFNVK
jgi:hypothetical protein